MHTYSIKQEALFVYISTDTHMLAGMYKFLKGDLNF